LAGARRGGSERDDEAPREGSGLGGRGKAAETALRAARSPVKALERCEPRLVPLPAF